MKKWIIGAGTATLTTLFIGLLVVVYTLARGQQGILQKEPNYTAVEYYQKSQEQVDKQDYKQAELYLEKALEKEDKPEYRSQLALAKYQLGKYEESIGQYKALIQSKQDVAFAWNGIGNSYRDWALEAKDSERARLSGEAEKAYLSALRENPQYVAAYANLAILRVRLENPDGARAVLDEGVAKTGRDELLTTKSNLGL